MSSPYRILEDPDAVAQTIAEAIHLQATLSLHKRPSAPVSIALSGGSTPKRLYECLAQPPWRESIPWKNILLFFGDERAVAHTHPDSNYHMVHEALLQHVDVKAFPMDALHGDTQQYSQWLSSHLPHTPEGIPRFDIVLLGIGTDGHTASLFPNTPALHEDTQWVVMNPVPQQTHDRMTLTFPILNAARHIWILATGQSKQTIVTRCLSTHDPCDAPILRVQPSQGELLWWLDQHAAANL